MPEALVLELDQLAGAFTALTSTCAVVIRRHVAERDCVRWVSGVYRGRAEWSSAFGGEQFSLGHPFYTHFEEGSSQRYFAESAASNARVETYAPGLQGTLIALVAEVVGEHAVQRRGWCGPGVHVFPPGSPVAARGGVRHADTEGLSERHLALRMPAVTLLVGLQPAEHGGGLRVWNALHRGREFPSRAALHAASAVVSYGVGDLVLIDSYRVHQILPFTGTRDRITATVHAARLGVGVWECWF